MPRRIPVELDLNASPYLAEARKVEALTRQVDGEMNKLDRAVNAVDRDMAELAASTALAKRQVDDLGDKARGTAGELKLLDTRIAATKARVHELGLEFARTGDEVDGRALGRERGLLAKLQKLRQEMGVELAQSGGMFASGLSGAVDGLGPQMKAILIGSLVASVVAVAPGLLAILGGVLSGAVGTGFMAAGILSASKDEGVRAAAAKAGHNVAEEFFGSAAFVEPTKRAIGILEKAFHDLNVGGSLGQLAPTVDIIATGFADFARYAAPGVNAALSRMVPFANAAASGMAGLGAATGKFFDDISKHEGAVEGLAAGFAFLNGFIVVTGETINKAQELFHVWLTSQRDFFGAMRAAAGAVGLDKLAGQLGHVEERYRALLEAGKPIPPGIAAIGTATESMGEKAKLADAATGGLAAALDDLHRGFLDWMGAEIGAEQALDDLAEKFRGGAGALDVHTQKGRDNLKLLQDLARAAKDAAEAKYAETSSVAEAEAVYAGYRAQLELTLQGLGYTKQRAHELADEWLGLSKLPPITLRVKIQVVGTGAAKYLLEGATADLLGGQHRAAGGPLIPGHPYVFGENGPEIGVFGQPGQMYSNPQSQQMAQQWAGGGAPSAPQRIDLAVTVQDTSGRTLRKLLIDDALNRAKRNDVVAAAYP